MKEQFGLYLILTDPVTSYETCAEAAVSANLRYLQLRMKNTPRNQVIEMGQRLKKITSGSNTRLIINDDIQVAMECDADGVHLGQDDLSLAEARKVWNEDGKIFGLSTHSMKQALQAHELAPDYIGIGPVFPTQTKAVADPVVGPGEAGKIARETSLTSVAIGGINSENLPQLLQAGIRNYCVVSAVNAAPAPLVAIRELQAIWKSHTFCT